jgi:2-octaprenyl-6-methoxyphenol hydroxylase
MHDAVIVGGGPAGATLALALADSGLDYVVVDARAKGTLGARDRTLALSHTARLVFERVGVWRRMSSITPIVTVDVSQRGHFGTTTLTAKDLGVPALGYVVRYAELQDVLDRALDERGIAVDYSTRVESVTTDESEARIVARTTDRARELACRLVVVADGGGELLPDIPRRKVDYRQQAVVALVDAEHVVAGVAYERFTADGPTALLPFESGYALVWTATRERAAELLALPDAEFLEALWSHFGNRAGRFTGVSGRASFPLTLQFAPRVTGRRAVVLGNAAQALHPIAGQGFNLGLRDVWAFAESVFDTAPEDVGSREHLSRYERSRKTDRWAGVVMTHSLVRGFESDAPLAAWSRGLGLTLLDSLPPLRRAFARAMMNGVR